MKAIHVIFCSACICLLEILSSHKVEGISRSRQYGLRNRQRLSCGIQKVQCQETGCNSNVNSRIIGGKEAYRGEFPWLVVLKMSNTQKQFCAGTLIGKNFVLTANHCLFDFVGLKLARLRVILGDYNIKTTSDGRHEEHRVDKIFSHPKWNINTNENDIAIIRLRKPVNFTDYIQPICLGGIRPKPQDIYEDDQTFATIAGWGRTNLKNNHKSPVPLKATVSLRDHEECRKRYLPFLVTKSMICAGGDGKDACLGDSGGGLYFETSETPRNWDQIGIISWGNSCSELPGVYTRIESYLPWILKTIQTKY